MTAPQNSKCDIFRNLELVNNGVLVLKKKVHVKDGSVELPKYIPPKHRKYSNRTFVYIEPYPGEKRKDIIDEI